MKKIILLFSFLFLSAISFAQDYVVTLDDMEVSYDYLTSKPKTILFLWTTWCPYCREELDYLNKQDSLYPGVEIIYWNVGENKKVVERLLNVLKAKDSIRKKIVLDYKNMIVDKFSIVGFPTFIFLKGREVVSIENYMDDDLVADIFDVSREGDKKNNE